MFYKKLILLNAPITWHIIVILDNFHSRVIASCRHFAWKRYYSNIDYGFLRLTYEKREYYYYITVNFVTFLSKGKYLSWPILTLLNASRTWQNNVILD